MGSGFGRAVRLAAWQFLVLPPRVDGELHHAGAALEPRAAVASWDGDNLTVWKSTRGVHADQLALSLALDVPRGNIRVMGQNMGAGYGTKDETRLGAITAVLAQRAGRPVKIELTRQEEFVAGRHRHGTTTTVRMGVKNDGTVTVVHATTIMDTGAYLSSGPGVIRRAGQGALYLYRCANVQYDGYLTYTNTPSGGSYRALGAPQGHFALESLADTISEALGIDPLEFRLKNHVGLEGQPGERVTPANEILDTQPVEGGVPFSSNGLRECLQIGSEAIDWGQPSEQPESGNLRRGKGMGMFIYRGGAGGRRRPWPIYGDTNQKEQYRHENNVLGHWHCDPRRRLRGPQRGVHHRCRRHNSHH